MRNTKTKEKKAKSIEGTETLQINMSSGAFDELDQLTNKRMPNDKARMDVVSRSLGLFKYLKNKKTEGSKIIVRDEKGNEKEVIV